MLKNRFYILFLLFAAPFACAQELYFHPQMQQGRLNYSSVSSITQDAAGRIWVIMGNDVLRYDGYTYYSYGDKLIREVLYFASYNALFCTRGGDLYLSTSHGLLRYDASEDGFRKVNNCSARRIFEDAAGNLWLGNGNVMRFCPQTGECVQMMFNGRNVVGHIYASPDSGVVYVFANEELLQYDVALSEWSSVPFRLPHSDLSIRDIEASDSSVYILTERHGLYVLRHGQPSTMQPVAAFPNAVARHLVADSAGRLWIGTMQGLWCYDPATGGKTVYTKSPHAGGLLDNSIQAVFFDHDDNLWVGTYAGSLCLASERRQHHFCSLHLADYGISPVPVSCIAEYKDGLYIGTEGDGLYRYSNGKGITGHFTDKVLHSNNIKTLVATENRLWIGTYLGGLSLLQNGTVRHIPLPSNEIYAATGNADGLWLSYQSFQEQITHINYADTRVDNYVLPRLDGQNLSSRIYRVCLADTLLWIATRSSLHCFSTSQRQYLYTRTPDEPAGIMALAYDSVRRLLWLGTRNRGILSYNPATGEFAPVAGSKERIQGDIRTLATTDTILWIGTDQGVYTMHLQDHSIHHYTSSDGVETAVFCSLRSELHPGRIYVGGVGTVSYIEEADLTYNPVPPRTLFSDIHINGRSVYTDSAYCRYIAGIGRGGLNLRHDENNLTFTLSSTNYLIAEKNRYRFRLSRCSRFGNRTKGNAIWNEVSSDNRTVMLTQLPAGYYRLEARSCNNDGVWGEPAVLNMRIRPIFWASGWAYMIYGLAFLLVCGYILYNRYRHRKLSEQLYRTEVRAEEQRLATESKVRFFAQYCIERGNDKQREEIQTRLDQLTHLIGQRIDNGHVDIDAIAREMGMSRRSLYGFVKENTGQSVIEYIRSYRIAEAARLMMAERLSIKQAMTKVGIDSQSYFVKIFKQEFGQTPTEYIANMSKQDNP